MAVADEVTKLEIVEMVRLSATVDPFKLPERVATTSRFMAFEAVADVLELLKLPGFVNSVVMDDFVMFDSVYD